MIEGIPASISIAIEIGRISRGGQSSVRKIAMPIPTGTAINSATKEVISVPINGESPPKIGSGMAFGAQRTVVMKFKP